jgi:hypothetical protein
VAPVHNAKAVGAFVTGLLALAILAAAAALPRFLDSITPLRALVVIPAAVLLALVSIALARRARFEFQRTLGRIGGDGLALTGWVLGILALLVSLTAAVAFFVYAVLPYTQI